MIHSVHQLAIRFLKNSKLLVITSVLGILLSVSLIIIMMMFITSSKEAMSNELEMMFGKMDLMVGYNDDVGKVIDENYYYSLINNPLIKEHSGVLLSHLFVDEINGLVYTIGANNDELTKTRYHFTENINDSEIILNNSLAERAAVTVGDFINIEGHKYEVKEIKPDLVAAGPTVNTIILNRDQLKQINKARGMVDAFATYILITTKDEQQIYEVAQQLRERDIDLRIDIAQEEDYVKNNITLLYQYMIVLSVLVILMTILFVITNFDVFLYKYKNQIAIMRSIGASTVQVFQVIFIQAFLINILGCVGGLLLTLLSYKLVYPGLEALLGITVQDRVFDFNLAIIMTSIIFVILQVGMVIPAYKSSRILPLKIIQANEKIDVSYSKLRIRMGLAAVVFSGLFVILIKRLPNQDELVLISVLLFLFGIFLLLPSIVKLLLKGVQLLPRVILGRIPSIAINMMIPQVKSNTFVIAIITLMIMVTIFGSSFINTIQQSDEDFVRSEYYSNILISVPIAEEQNFHPDELHEALHNSEHLDSIFMVSLGTGGYIKELQGDYINYVNTFLVDLVPTIRNIETGVILTKELAQQLNVKIGEHFNLRVIDSKVYELVEVVGIVDELPRNNKLLVDFNTTLGGESDYYGKPYTPIIEHIYIEAENQDAAVQSLQDVMRQYPEIQVSNFEQSLVQSKEMSKQRIAIFLIVLIIILICVMIGVINTLINNVNAKRREISILRVISMTKNEIIQFIITQVLIYVVIGIVIGTVVGVVLSWIISLIDSGQLIFNFTVYGFVVGGMLILTLVVFIPYGVKIGNLPILKELTKDNK